MHLIYYQGVEQASRSAGIDQGFLDKQELSNFSGEARLLGCPDRAGKGKDAP